MRISDWSSDVCSSDLSAAARSRPSSSHRKLIMSDRTLDILKSRRFLPLFVTQFLGAFNDNLYKNALVILILFRLAADAGQGEVLVAVAGGLFVLPFFLFSATAGQLADKYDKARLIRVVKAAEIVVMGLADRKSVV